MKNLNDFNAKSISAENVKGGATTVKSYNAEKQRSRFVNRREPGLTDPD